MTSKVGLNVNWVTSTNYKRIDFYSSKHTFNAESMRLPRVELGSIAWKAIILTVGLQTLRKPLSNKYNWSVIIASITMAPIWTMYIAPIWMKIDMLYNIHYFYLKLSITIMTGAQTHPKNKVSRWMHNIGLDVNE